MDGLPSTFCRPGRPNDILFICPQCRVWLKRYFGMTVLPENGPFGGNDLELGIGGFTFSDLFDAIRLKDLADAFYAEVGEHDTTLHSALTKYITARGIGYERKVESKILTDAAPYLSD